MTTLLKLMEEYGGNGFVLISDGNGAIGPSWIEWDEDIAKEFGDTKMGEVSTVSSAYEGDDKDETVMDVTKYVINDYATDNMFASVWIEDDNRDAPYHAVNPYHYRIIF